MIGVQAEIEQGEGAERACQNCGVMAPWVWIEGCGWMPPPRTCRVCSEEIEERTERERVQESLQRAGIPERYRGWSLQDLDYQGQEDGYRWRSRHRARLDSGERVLGVLSGDEEAVEGLDAWRPEHGWVWLEGRCGSGKTLLACMAAERLIREPLRWEALLGGEWVDPQVAGRAVHGVLTLRRRGGWEVTIISEADAFSDQRADKNREPGERTTIRRLIDAGVLVWDDAGQSLEDAGPVLPQRREFFEQLVDARYRQSRPMLLTSNLSLRHSRTEALLGKRAHGRLLEMVGPRNWTLHGDWRMP
jgi:DNA replication protein DnaC